MGHGLPVLSRRALVEVGYASAIGLGLPSLAGAGEADSSRRAKSVLFVFLTGAPSQVDTFDMKPDAPAEIRGDFKPIATTVPGLLICEHLPLFASHMHKLALVRSITCGRELGAHDFATHAVLAGINRPPAGPTRAASRHDWPCYAAGLDYLSPCSDGLPSGVHLPNYLADGGVGAYPGQNAGWLGGKHDPWQVTQDPNRKDFQVAGLKLPIGLTVDSLARRQSLLARMDRQRRELATLDQPGQLTEQQSRAARFLVSGRLADAFAIEREPDKVRDHYGRHLFGQSLLLARRLLQAGVPIVQANLGIFTAHWDTHIDNCKNLKDALLPPFDRAISALFEDLSETGLLAETLVVVMGEFGRTPKLGGNLGTPTYSPAGRDHWTDCFFSLFAGAGVRGGQIIGASDRIGAYPVTTPYHPADIGATIYSALGVDPAAEITDRLGRPMRLNSGEVIEALYSGA